MKIYLNKILVVEGKEDASYLSNYIDSEIVIVNGYELNETTINYLKDKEVLLLLDPDEAGLKIRKSLNEVIPNCTNVEVDIKRCTRGTKNGVAECEIDEVLQKLRPFGCNYVEDSMPIKMSELYDLGLLNNKELRRLVSLKLNLGNCNGKTLHKRLISNNISVDKLKEIIKDINNDNR